METTLGRAEQLSDTLGSNPDTVRWEKRPGKKEKEMTVLQDQPEGRVVREAKKGWTMCTRVPPWIRGQALRSRTHEKLRFFQGLEGREQIWTVNPGKGKRRVKWDSGFKTTL